MTVDKVRLTEMGHQTNCKAASETYVLKTKRGLQLCSNFIISLRIKQSLSSCHAELDAKILQRSQEEYCFKTKTRGCCLHPKFNKMLTVFFILAAPPQAKFKKQIL
jgi:hypothetical protein